jgi:FdhD protein
LNSSHEVEKFSILRIKNEERIECQDQIVKEIALTIFFNDTEIVTILCSPVHLNFLALGFLLNQGFLKTKKEIKNITLEERKGLVWVESSRDVSEIKGVIEKRLITPGCGKGVVFFYHPTDAILSQKNTSSLSLSPATVSSLMKEMQERSFLYRTTGGVHSAALADGKNKNILFFHEDIGRHNAIDKVIGQCFWEEISLADKIVVTTGRISSEILFKMAKQKIPVLISRSAPTNQAIKFAQKLGITLIGFVRAGKMNIYSHSERIS